jgi:hypothetical protein
MNGFAILNSRKRALIALVHSFILLGAALHGFASAKPGVVVHGFAATPDVILIMIYVVVASVLAWLVSVSGCARERLYFALCAGSATFGLLRTIFGDAALPAAQYLRVVLLSCAGVLAAWVFRFFSQPVTENVTVEP